MAINYKEIGLKALSVSIIFTTFDYLIHLWVKSLKIVNYPYQILGDNPLLNYALVKLVASFIIIFVVLWLISLVGLELGLLVENIIVLIILVFALQFRYSALGYSENFNVLNLFNHVVTLLVALFTYWYFGGDDN